MTLLFVPSAARTWRHAQVALWVAASMAACGGGGGSATPAPVVPPTENPQDAALSASKPGELVAYFQERLRLRAERGVSVGAYNESSTTGAAVTLAAPVVASASSASNASMAKADVSGTTVQEAGVDEEDWLKTDGTMVFSMAKDHAGTEKLLAHTRLMSGSATVTISLAASLPLGTGTQASGMLYAASAKRIVVLGSNAQSYGVPIPVPMLASTAGATAVALSGGAAALIAPNLSNASNASSPAFYTYSKPQITLRIINTTAAASGALAVEQSISIDGAVVGSRLIGNTLYLVSRHAPNVSADLLPTSASAADRQAAIAKLSAAEILPTISVGGVTDTLVKDTDCFIQSKNAALDIQISSITAIDLASPTLARKSSCFAGGSESIYVSLQSIYLATTRYTPNVETINGTTRQLYSTSVSTDIHKFSINGPDAAYKGSGSVAGHLGWDAAKKPYRMGEHKGDLRVLSFTGERGWFGDAAPVNTANASPAKLTVLREAAGVLSTLSVLPNSKRPAAIGLEGEQVYAVRFVDARAYVVTFRRTDPLYVLDLANPSDPLVAGVLKAPGFSDYLIPLGDSLLLGVGKDASDSGLVQGVKVALFDVANPAAPTELASRSIGKRGSTSGLDFSSHGINILQTNGVARIALPVRVNDKADYTPGLQSLYRWEVDLTAKSLADKPSVETADFSTLGASAAYNQFDMARERSVQIGDAVFQLSGGVLGSFAW